MLTRDVITTKKTSSGLVPHDTFTTVSTDHEAENIEKTICRSLQLDGNVTSRKGNGMVFGHWTTPYFRNHRLRIVYMVYIVGVHKV